MKWIRCGIMLAAFAGLLTQFCAADDVSPWDLWRQGYTAYEKGESARDSGDHVRALEHFQNAAKITVQYRKPGPAGTRM